MVGPILITGATGFVGVHLCESLRRSGRELIAVSRAFPLGDRGAPWRQVALADFVDREAWKRVLEGVEAVVHLAVRAHVLRETETDPEAAFRRANVDATEALAEAAAERGVRRLVFVSSIGVHGRGSPVDPITENSPIRPEDAYARSKVMAERALCDIALRRNLEYVIIRPPLVHGPKVKGNFLRLLRLAASGVPLPFASCSGRRSFIGIANLCDLIALAIDHPSARGGLFVAADDKDFSIGELIRLLRGALGVSERLFAMPARLLRIMARAAGRTADLDRLLLPLRVDATRARNMLGWSPRLSSAEGLAQMARWYAGVRQSR